MISPFYLLFWKQMLTFKYKPLLIEYEQIS
jgi:hypothetical protein